MLFPSILFFCCVGTFSVNNSLEDVYITAAFGLLGYVFLRLSLDPAQLMLGDLENHPVPAVLCLKRVQDRRQVILELHVDDSANDLRDFSDCVGCSHIVLVAN